MLIIINGASGAGKTFLLKHLRKLTGNRYVPIKKYTTRAKRAYEEDPSVDLVFSCSDSCIDSCTFKYIHRNEKYGIAYDEIVAEISQGHVPVIIIRSFETIREVKSRFSDARMYFIVGSVGEELRVRLTEQGRNSQQIESAIAGVNDIFEDLEHNRDLVDDYLFNQYNEEKYLNQFQRLISKGVVK